MAHTPHEPVKPEKLVAAAAVLLEEQLVVPAAFRREGIDAFRGAKDDTINVKVPGVLPFRKYAWRNDRSAALVVDKYKERKIAMTFGGNGYSAVELTDEESEMDFAGWTQMAVTQTEAIARGLNSEAQDALLNAPFEVVVTLDEADLRGSLIRLKKVADRLRAPGIRTIFVDNDLEVALLDDDKLNLAINVGEAEAVTALREASLGRRFGFNFVTADELPAGESVLKIGDGFVFLNAAPSVPQSAGFGATSSHNGVSLRWIKGYDHMHQVEQSVFNTWYDFDYVTDPLVGQDVSGDPIVSLANHFVRGVKVELGAAYNVELSNAELSDITGIASTDGTSDGA